MTAVEGRPAGSVREVRAGVWQIQVTAGRDPVTGRRRRPTTTVHGTRADAERERARLLSGHGVAAAARLTVERFFVDHWLEHKASTRRERTVRGYAGYVEREIIPAFGHLDLADVSPMHVDRWLVELRRRGLSERTVLHAFRILRAGFRQAMRWRLITADPTDAVDPPSPRWSLPATLTAEQAGRMLQIFCRLEPVDTAVVLALGGGLRRSEQCGLEWPSVDLDAGEIRIVQGRHDGGVIAPPKSETSRRTVALAPWAAGHLRVLRRAVGPVDGFVVAARPDQITKAYRVRLTAAGWGDAPPLKNLRHTHASLALAAGVPLEVVSRRLGHSTIGITHNYYVSTSREADRDVAARMGELIAMPATADSPEQDGTATAAPGA